MHQRFILSELLCRIDSIEETIGRFDARIESYCAPFEEAVAHLDTIPGVARATAELMERGEDYQDSGADYFERRQPEALARRLTKRLQGLGFEVSLSPVEKGLALE